MPTTHRPPAALYRGVPSTGHQAHSPTYYPSPFGVAIHDNFDGHWNHGLRPRRHTKCYAMPRPRPVHGGRTTLGQAPCVPPTVAERVGECRPAVDIRSVIRTQQTRACAIVRASISVFFVRLWGRTADDVVLSPYPLAAGA